VSIELTTHAIEDRIPVIAGVGFGQRLAIEMAQAAGKGRRRMASSRFPPY
jgi:dihydrodipicolinate synthase/N-acetylneuraminate lyase